MENKSWKATRIRNYMIKSIVLFVGIICMCSWTSLKAQKHEIEPWKYNINIELNDSTLLFNISIKATKSYTKHKDFLLLNRYIEIKEAYLDNSPLKYTRSNDTLYFESSQKKEMTLFIKYEISCSMTGSSKVISSYGDSIYTYPIQFDTSQIFFERFNKWYPVLYDNFSNYKVTIIVPKTHKVFAYYPETSCKRIDGKDIYSYHYIDEDFPFLITESSIFQPKKIILHNKTYFEFNFLPRPRRLLSVVDKKPVYISNSQQIDSLINVIINRSIDAFDWYNANLWKQQIDTLRFVETGIFGLGSCLNSFIIIDRSLMNMEALDNYAFSHEIGHLWIGDHTEYLAKGKYFLGESINEYVNLLYYESWAGEEAFEKAIQDKIIMKYSEEPFFLVSFNQVLNQKNGNLQYELIYSKGVVFVQEFRKMIGKENLLKIIRETYSVPNHFVALKDFENSIKANGFWNEYLKLYEMKL